MTKERYRFGWFSMKLKLVGGDSAGVVTAYYVSPSFFARFLLYLNFVEMDDDVGNDADVLGERGGAGEGRGGH